eukprot:1313907-Rhodomonas_salina.1
MATHVARARQRLPEQGRRALPLGMYLCERIMSKERRERARAARLLQGDPEAEYAILGMLTGGGGGGGGGPAGAGAGGAGGYLGERGER